MNKWVRVKKNNPCPICGKPDYCAVADDGTVAYCMRVMSDKPVEAKDGSVGYIHTLKEDDRPQYAKRVTRPEKQATLSPVQWFELAMGYRAGVDLIPLSESLGVSAKSLERCEYGQGWIRYNGQNGPMDLKGWTSPMRDGRENIIGIRTRHDWFKGSYPGSQNGLCIPDEIGHRELTIVEGFTDPPALLDIGVDVIGRATCSANVQDIKVYVERTRPKRIIVLSDNDTAKIRPDGSKWFPGQEGALKLAHELPYHKISVYVTKPIRCKDAREWLGKGLTAALYDDLIKNTRRFCG